MADRCFKLRQMFHDYLDHRRDVRFALLLKKSSAPQPDETFLAATDEIKKRLSLKNIVEEEAEVLEACEMAKPILIRESVFEMNWDDNCRPKVLPLTLKTLNPDKEAVNLLEAKKLLQLLSRMRILELNSFQSNDIRVLNSFFAGDTKDLPSDRLLSVLDYVFSKSIADVICNADKTNAKDASMLAFLQDQSRAKAILLEVMLRNPELIPDPWGKHIFLAKRREQNEKKEVKRALDALLALREVEQATEKDRDDKDTQITRDRERDKDCVRETEMMTGIGKEKERDSKKKNERTTRRGGSLKMPDSEKTETSRRKNSDKKRELRKKGALSGRKRKTVKGSAHNSKEKDKDTERELPEKDKKKEKEKEKHRKSNKDTMFGSALKLGLSKIKLEGGSRRGLK